MTASDLARKYGVTKREIDYWTEIGLLTTTYDKHSKCFDRSTREYGPESDERMKKILIAKLIKSESSLKEWVNLLDNLPHELWDQVVIGPINTKIQELTRKYTDALKYANELKG